MKFKRKFPNAVFPFHMMRFSALLGVTEMAVARHKRSVGGVKAANRVEVHRFLCHREAESNAVPVLVQVLALYCFFFFLSSRSGSVLTLTPGHSRLPAFCCDASFAHTRRCAIRLMR